MNRHQLAVFVVMAFAVGAFFVMRIPRIPPITPAALDGRLNSQQRRISELENRVDALATALRMERQDTDYDRQRRENARDR